MEDQYPKYVENYPIEKLKLNNWNPNKMDKAKFESLVRSIKERKFIVPIVANKDGIIADGEHRYLASVSTECNLSVVPVILVDMSEDELKLSTLGLNGIRGENSPLAMAKLLQELNQRYSLKEISSLIGGGESELKDKLELLKIPEDLIEKLKEEAKLQEQLIPIVMNFVLNKGQQETVITALDKCAGKSKSEKLETICVAYLK
jgi:ParB/RepB/Spo0J family partition protein